MTTLLNPNKQEQSSTNHTRIVPPADATEMRSRRDGFAAVTPTRLQRDADADAMATCSQCVGDATPSQW
jgi:hypothetical protein